MCGIGAYLGDRQAAAILVAMLQRQEYRGYDSAGIGLHAMPLVSRKKVGKVANLREACGDEGKPGGQLDSTCGIAHTRWATHGKPSDVNSHPHKNGDGSIMVVHNGVIENFQALREQLTADGYVFRSETDTEVLAHLVDYFRQRMPQADWRQVVAAALHMVRGAYACVFLFQDEDDLLIAARSGSPLILGVGVGEFFLSSDACAVVEHTKNVIYLKEGSMVELRRGGFKILAMSEIVASALTGTGSFGAAKASETFGVSGYGAVSTVVNPIMTLEADLAQIEKGGYEHFMLKEIMDQPNALKNAMRGRIHKADDARLRIKLGGLEKLDSNGSSFLDRIAVADRILICACGTSWHSGLIGKYALEELAEVVCEVEYASEFRYRKPLISSRDVLLCVSQSGETADTLEAIRVAQAAGATTIGVVNGVGSSIARETDAGIYLHAGPEIGVASTKAFTCQTAVLLMLALKIAEHRGTLTNQEFETHCSALSSIPATLEAWLPSLDLQSRAISKYFRLAANSLFAGCGVHFPVALEGALKLKEISYIHAEGFPGSELKHAALALVEKFIPVFVIAFRSSPNYQQVKESIIDLKARRAAIVVLTEDGNADFDELANFIIHCPRTELVLEPLISVIPMQLLSYHIAHMRGCEIDQPKNLAKSVTVE